MRKAFNFFNSYYEVAKELNDKDRLAFLDALIKKQFTGKETGLTGMAKFAYLSQKHSIDAQIKGYFDKTKDPMFDPCQGGAVAPIEAPTVQEKEKEKEKEQHVIHPLQKFVSDNLENVSKMKKQLTYDECMNLINEFSRDAIKEILEAMENYKDLKKNISVNSTLKNWINIRRKNNPQFGLIQTNLSKEELLLKQYEGVNIHQVPIDVRQAVHITRQLHGK